MQDAALKRGLSSVNTLRMELRAVAVVLAALAVPASLLVGCSSSSDTTTSESSGTTGDCKTGANAAWATPAGAAFALPSGVSLKGEMNGEVASGPCATKTTLEYGGDLLPVCIGLENTTQAEITLKLSAGLVFLAKDPGTQNGIILQDHEVKLAPGTTYVRIDLFCLNEHCLFGQGAATIFSFGNVTNDPTMLELIGLARGRKLTRGAALTASVFGKAVWEITGGAGLTAERKKAIADTPDGS